MRTCCELSSPERNGLSRLKTAVTATAARRQFAFVPFADSASRSIRECRGLIGKADIALPSGVSIFF